MTRKRDCALEIRDRPSRLGGVDRLFTRLRTLLAELDKAAEISDELMRYFPVAMVACMETYTRTMVEELVDAGPPFSERIDAFRDQPIELQTMKAIHGRRITLGELLGHLTPVSKLADMQRSLNPLLETDIVDLVKTIRAGDGGHLIESVESTFRLRHIYAHEFPTTGAVDRELIAESVRAAAEFLTALDKGILDIAFTQNATNRHTAEQWERLDKELNDVLRELSAGLSADHASHLAKAQEAWELVRDHTAHLMADFEAEGGSMWPMVYNRFAAEMTRHRLDELRDLRQFNW